MGSCVGESVEKWLRISGRKVFAVARDKLAVLEKSSVIVEFYASIFAKALGCVEVSTL